MIVRTVDECIRTERETPTDNWVSRRLLLKRDGMGFSLHETTVYKGTSTEMQYGNHLEAVFCVEGEGEVELPSTGDWIRILPGTVYALNEHDHHVLHAKTEMRLVCIFNPPVVGNEVHDASGAYPLVAD